MASTKLKSYSIPALADAAASEHRPLTWMQTVPTPFQVATQEPLILSNTTIHYPLFTQHSLPMPAGVLKPQGWKEVTRDFEDQKVITAILGICKFGARIGYHGHRHSVTIHPNLSTAEHKANLVSADINHELLKNRLETYPDFASLPNHYTASPLGLVDKSDGSKRRIHHLSYPPGDNSAINNGIPEEYGAIVYSTIEDTIQAIQHFGAGCNLIKRDFESAFRYRPVSPLDSPLLGFKSGERYYAEKFLPFGLRTALYIFNLFGKIFHWVLGDQLENQYLPVNIIHYLDDFLMVVPKEAKIETYGALFSTLCSKVGLAIKESKNE